MLSTLALAAVIAAVMIGDRLGSSARSLEFGSLRAIAVAVVAPAEWANHALGLDRMSADARRAVRSVLEPSGRAPASHLAPGAGTGSSSEPTATPPPPPPAEPTVTPPPTEPTVTPPASPVFRNPTPSASHPLRVTIAGDSMIEAFGKYLKADLVGTGVAQAVYELHYSSGLARPDYYDWPKRLRALMSEQDPDVVVIMLGANDGQNMVASGKRLDYGSVAWKEEYTRRVGAAMDIVAAGGRRVYWVGLPIARSDGYSAKCRVLNAIYQAEVKKREAVTYVDSWTLFSSADGTYSAYLKDASGTTRLMRGDDGIHFSVAGAHRMTDHLMDRLRVDYPLP